MKFIQEQNVSWIKNSLKAIILPLLSYVEMSEDAIVRLDNRRYLKVYVTLAAGRVGGWMACWKAGGGWIYGR